MIYLGLFYEFSFLCAFFFVRDLYLSGFFLNACLDFFLEFLKPKTDYTDNTDVA